MDSIELPSQRLVAVIEPPDFEEWKQRVHNASNEGLLKLRDTARLGLRGDGDDQRWSPYISVVEEEMRDHGIKP